VELWCLDAVESELRDHTVVVRSQYTLQHFQHSRSADGIQHWRFQAVQEASARAVVPCLSLA